MNATAKDLRFHSKELLDSVRRGEEVIITYRGKPCAKLVPIDEAEEMTQPETALFGIWKDNDEAADVESLVKKLRKSRF